nr:hypothetical protein [Klebsiella quasipneumoniae]
MIYLHICLQSPFFWGGGPFQNGTNNLHSLWSEKGFKERVAGIKVQWFNEDKDRLLTNAPPRKYYAHAAKRLADLVDSIRNKYPKGMLHLKVHSQGTMVAMAAVKALKNAPDALFVLNSPYALDRAHFSGAAGHSRTAQIICRRQSMISAIVRESQVSKSSGLMKTKIAC